MIIIRHNMKKIKREEQKVKPLMKLNQEFLDLRTLDTNIIINQLEEKIKLREMPIDQKAKLKLSRNSDQP